MKQKKERKLLIHPDGTIPLITDDIKVVYSSKEINTNWLLNQILGTKNSKITKVSDNEIIKFINILSISNLKMPDGSDSLEWLKKRLKKRFGDSITQRGEAWEAISKRYRYILEQIDIILATRPSVNQ